MANILIDLETQIGYPPFSGEDPSRFIKSSSEKSLYKAWLLAKGLNTLAVNRLKDATLVKAYQIAPYFNAIYNDPKNRGGKVSQRLNAINFDGEAAGESESAKAEARAWEYFDETRTPPIRTPNAAIFSDKSAHLSEGQQVLSADVLDKVRRAAEAVLPKYISNVEVNLKSYIDEKLQNAKLELSDDAKRKIADLAQSAGANEARRLFELWLPPKRIVFEDKETGAEREVGVQHMNFEKLYRACRARNADGHRLNIWLTGPAGSGKTTAAKKIAELLSLPFAFESSLDADYKVTGFVDAQGRIVSTEYIRIYQNGGIFLADEIDNWQPSATVALNASIANGIMATPGGMIERHKDCIIIAAGNTWGLGATNEYVGRNKLDAATLDRFQPKIDWPIDEKLELALASNHGEQGVDWCQTVQLYRRKVKSQGLHIMISPRATISGIALLEAGFEKAEVINMTFAAGLKPEQRQALDLSAN